MKRFNAASLVTFYQEVIDSTGTIEFLAPALVVLNTFGVLTQVKKRPIGSMLWKTRLGGKK